MAILKLSENLYISPQLSEADAAQAAKLGIKSVICNRPDGEEAGQPEAAQVRQWLEQAGIAAFRHQPVTAPAITDADIDTFHKLLAELPPPGLLPNRNALFSVMGLPPDSKRQQRGRSKNRISPGRRGFDQF